MTREIALLGTHPATSTDAADLDEHVELWAANEAHRGLVREPERVFQLHPPNWREAERRFMNGGSLPDGVAAGCFGRNREHGEYLESRGAAAYVQMRWDGFTSAVGRVWRSLPDATVYPFEQVTEAVGIPLPPNGNERLWATSTFGYMLALALAEHIGARDSRVVTPREGTIKPPYPLAKIHLYGVELPIGSQRERLWEWPNLAYYLGLARGLGIEIVLPETGSSLLSAPHYALDNHPQVGDPDHWWMPGQSTVIFDKASQVFRVGSYAEAGETP